MSGTGRTAAFVIANDGEAPKNGHLTRFQARVVGLDGRSVEVKSEALRAHRTRVARTEVEVEDADIAASYGIRVK